MSKNKRTKTPIKLHLRDGNWHYDFTTPVSGRIRKSTKTADYELASRIASIEYDEYCRVEVLKEKPKYLWQEAVMVWLNENPDRKNNKNLMYGLIWLDKRLKNVKIEDINRNVIESIKQEKQKENVKNRTLNAVLQQIRVVLKCAYNHDMLDKVPTIKLLSEPKRRIAELSAFQEKKLLAELPDHLKPIVEFAICTGLRMSNITGLRWNQVDIKNRLAKIHADQSKTGVAIGVPLNSSAVSIILSQQGKHREFVFTYNGKQIKNAGAKGWRKATERAGLKDFHFHDLRHIWASRHIEAGTSLYELMELGGWSQYDTVKKYAHLSKKHLQTAAERTAKTDKE